jgi:hypothetical protein
LFAFIYRVVYGVVFLLSYDDPVKFMCILYPLYRSGKNKEESGGISTFKANKKPSVWITEGLVGSSSFFPSLGLSRAGTKGIISGLIVITTPGFELPF